MMVDPKKQKARINAMQKGNCKSGFHSLLATLAIFLILSCVHTPDVVGRWREIGKTATIEFENDGTFKAIDNQGMAVNGTYTLQGNRAIRFEITRHGYSPEIVNGNVTVCGDELTFTSADRNEVERYKREK